MGAGARLAALGVVFTSLTTLAAGVAGQASSEDPILLRKRKYNGHHESRLEMRQSSTPTMEQIQDVRQNSVSLVGSSRRRLTESRRSLEMDMLSLILELNADNSMSMITVAPTPAPTISNAPTETDCANPITCANRLLYQIEQISIRMGTLDALSDPASAQSLARNWILEECDAATPIEYCGGDVQLVLNEQRYALAVLYFSLGGNEWNAGANPNIDKSAPEGVWLSGKNYCDWGSEMSGSSTNTNGTYDQLVCDEFGNVLYLNLQANNMIGTIAPEIGVLVYLTSYISFFNAQSGPIPTTLGLLTSLETFDIESNNMDGNLFQPEYMPLTNLVNFRASINNFGGTIPPEVGSWTRLQNLWFADNEISGSIPTEVGNLIDLEAFLIYNNQITGTIPTEIGNLDKLEWVDMESNQLVGTIPEEFYTNLALEQVVFKNNSLSGSISDAIGDLTKMTKLWYSFNELTGTIPVGFGNLVNLKELELQDNMLTGTIPVEFGSFEAIEFLSVEQNKLTGPMPSDIFGGNLQALRILYLNNNALTGTVPENYGASPRLQDLWLNDNLLTGTLPVIAEGEFLFLEELLLQNNDLTGAVDDSICRILNTTGGGSLGVLHSDCQPPKGGGAPQIVCSCCTACFE